MDLQHGWQPAKEDPAELRLAGHVAADEFGDLPSSAHAGNFETLRENSSYLFRMVHRFDERSVSHGVWIAVRNDEDVPCVERKRPIIPLDLCVAVAFCQQVKDDHVRGTAHEQRRQRARFGRRDTPRLGELGVEIDGGIELDGPEDLR